MSDRCTKDTCPASVSIYGYAPSLAANAVFLALFLVSCFIHLFQGIKYKTWSFLIAMCLGTLCEAVGEGGRIMLHNDPFSDAGFKLQIVLLTFAPAFMAAGIYLTLKHLVITFGQDFSRIKPAWYTYIFITCDIFSIVLQGAGGGLASAADDDRNLLNAGNNLMIAGLAFQVFTLVIFAVLASEYFFRVWKNRHHLNPETIELRHSLKFKGLLAAIVISYFAILIRCVYRVAEMAGGWGNSIMQDEALFIALDSVMCIIAVLVFNAFHPGRCFEYRSWASKRAEEKVDEESPSPIMSQVNTTK
ncbi:RTA1-domain-containing protein [Aulographum hederae CBS 113979]|uniref:RTA1-domain-containing protein n=1 Tax=Aulographum hederae CBS 113979 TaxID=1176131 RepID=A0A6G1GPM0_9PEZI|nr:RTA1-domain-containing protein [Aulographum hederae CBS 113979]